MVSTSQYFPKPLSDPVGADIELLIGQLLDQRVTFVTGAGASHGDPSSLPLAEQLAARLHAFFRDGFAREALAGVVPTDLLAVADAISVAGQPDGDRLLQEHIARQGFGGAQPNHAHIVLSMLFAERLISVALTTNYDTCIERASAELAEDLVACRQAAEMQGGQDRGRLIKLHGCVSTPPTIKVTTAQLGDPFAWALASLSVALQRDALVVIGIASLAPYIKSTMESIWSYSPQAESVWIVSPQIGGDWDALLGSPGLAHRVERTAEAFLDDLLRGVCRRQLTALRNLASQLDTEHQTNSERALAVGDLITQVEDIPADWLVLYLRKRLVPRGGVAQIAFATPGIRALLAVAMVQAATGEPLRILRCGNEVYFLVGELLVEVVFATAETTAAETAHQVRNLLATAKLRGQIPQQSKQVLVLSSGHFGQLPPRIAPDHLVSGAFSDDLIDGPQQLNDHWIELSAISNAPALDNVRQTIMAALA